MGVDIDSLGYISKVIESCLVITVAQTVCIALFSEKKLEQNVVQWQAGTFLHLFLALPMCVESISCCDQPQCERNKPGPVVWKSAPQGRTTVMSSKTVCSSEESWVEAEEMSVCGSVGECCTKWGTGPCWCGTKCHSLIRINSLWDWAASCSRGKHVCVVTHCFCSLSHSL